MKKVICAFFCAISFNLAAQPVNDDCVNAITLTPAPVCNNTPGTNAGAVTFDYDGCSEVDKRTVWYKFIATQSNHVVQLTLGTMSRGIIDLVAAPCGSSSMSTCAGAQNGPVITRNFSGLTAGQEYLVVISNPTGDQEGTFDVCVITPPPPVNDDCVNALNLVPAAGNLPVFTSGTSLFATQSQPGCNGNANDDVWYKFTATQTAHRIIVNRITMTGTPIVEVFSGTCGGLVSMQCFSNSPSSNSAVGLVPGQEYFVRVYDNGTSEAGSFNIAITSAPQNDECSSAITIVPLAQGAFCSTPLLASTLDATLSSNDCFTFTTTDDDVWYNFTATHTAHNIRLNGFGSNLGRVELFTGSCGSLNSFIACNGYTSYLLGTDTVVYSFGMLSPGTVYTFRVYSNATGLTSNFGLCIATPFTLANDECSGALNIIPSPDSSFTAITQSVNLDITSSRQPVCGASTFIESLTSRDLWYKFTATSQQHTIYLSKSGTLTFGMYMYTGSCGSLSTFVCRGGSNNTLFSIGNLVPGTEYFYRIVVDIQFEYTVSTAVFTPTVEPNDECSGAISITPSATVACTGTVSGNTLRSTHSQPVCPGSFTNLTTILNDMWYSFQANHTSMRVRVTIRSGSGNSAAFQVYTGVCGSLTPIFCSTQMFSTDTLRERRLDGLVIGQTYFIRIFSPAGSAVPFTICVKRVVPPVNDECTGAIVLPVASSIQTMQMNLIDILDASQSQAGCTGNADDDLWYSFTAPNDSVVVYAHKTYTSDLVIQLFTGSCGSLTSISCNTRAFDANVAGVVLLTGLAPGTVYFFRAYATGGFAAGGVAGTLRVGLYEPSVLPSNDACADAITLVPSANNDVNSVTGNNFNSFTNNTNCQTGGLTSDVWYRFVATAVSHKIVVDGDIHLPQIQVLNGSCAGASLVCVSASFPQFSETTLSSLVIGNTYFIRVFNGSVDIRSQGNFRVAVTTPQIPVNDNCTGAIPLQLCAENTVCNNSPLYSTNLATASGDISACSGSAGNDDVWFQFTATDKRIAIAADLYNNALSMQLLQGNCSGFTSLVCQASRNILICPLLVDGQTYYIRIFSASAAAGTRSSFKIKVYEIEPHRAIDPLRPLYDTACLGPVLNANGQFETFIGCPSGFAGTATPGSALLTNWTIPTAGTPDYFGDCGHPLNGLPSVTLPGNNCFGYQEPRSGKFYAGVFAYSGGSNNYREYLQGELNTALVPGKKYMVSFYTSLSDYSSKAIDRLGVRFNTSITAQNISGPLSMVPQVVSPAGTFITEQKKWVNIRAIFTADQAYTHFIIGNFNNNAGTNLTVVNDTSGLINGGTFPGCASAALTEDAYYFIDDVSVSEITGVSAACVGDALPVKWISFEAKRNGKDALLTWQTSNESNCSHYTIERSSDGSSFLPIGSTLCYNNSGNNMYRYTDIQPGAGKYYYRVRQHDLDGKTSLTPIRSVAFDQQQLITVSPNPAHDYFTIESSLVIEKIVMMDMQGRKVKEPAPAPGNKYAINDLPAGIYIISITAGNSVNIVRLVKQ